MFPRANTTAGAPLGTPPASLSFRDRLSISLFSRPTLDNKREERGIPAAEGQILEGKRPRDRLELLVEALPELERLEAGGPLHSIDGLVELPPCRGGRNAPRAGGMGAKRVETCSAKDPKPSGKDIAPVL